MESKRASLCYYADSRYSKTDAKRATFSLVLKPGCYDSPFVILLYLITVLGLILPYHGTFAGME